MEDVIGLALPLRHRLAERETIELADLAGESWIGSTPRSSVHGFTEAICRDAGFEAEVKFETDDYHVAEALVATGVGIAFLPRLAAVTAHPEIVFRHVTPAPPARRVFAVYRAGGLRSPTTSAMVELLEQIGRETELTELADRAVTR